MSERVKDRRPGGVFVLGAGVTLADPGMVAVPGRAGFRGVATDGPPAAIRPESVRALVQVAQGAGIWPPEAASQPVLAGVLKPNVGNPRIAGARRMRIGRSLRCMLIAGLAMVSARRRR